MTIIQDPLHSLRFELPSGWAYDLLYSTLTDFSLSRWDRPEEMLVVHLRRTSAAIDQTDEAWVETIRAEVGGKATLFDIDSANGRVVAADIVSGQGMNQRVAFLRGTHVDIAVEQRNADIKSPEPWKALERAVTTAVSEANRPLDGECSPAEFNRTIETANRAFEEKDYARVIAALEDAIRIGRTAWLVSLTSPERSPEISAAVRVAQAMIHLGRFTENPFPVRDAALILRRALCSLEAAGKGAMEHAKELVAEMKEALDGIQSEFLDKKEPDAGQDSAPIVAVRERGFRLAQASAMAFDAGDFGNASGFAGAAVEDFLFLLAYFRRGRAQQLPEEIVKHLVNQGISDHEEQRDAIQRVREGALFPALNLSLQIRYCCAMDQKDPEGASEAVELLLPLARRIAATMPGDTAIALNLALALMNGVGVIAARRDKEKLQEATGRLEEASRILEATGGKGCQDDGWVRNHKPQNEKSLEALKLWLDEAAKAGDAAAGSALQSLHSAFENAAGRLGMKINRSSQAGS